MGSVREGGELRTTPKAEVSVRGPVHASGFSFGSSTAPNVVYPMEGTVGPDSGDRRRVNGKLGGRLGTWASGGATPDRYLGSATVTITWAIG